MIVSNIFLLFSHPNFFINTLYTIFYAHGLYEKLIQIM